MAELIVVGGGLAGTEAAWQAASRGIKVDLYEMRPAQQTGAHIGDRLAELVCSNSLGSNLIDRASGLLKEEIRKMGSLLLECADKTSLPAGGALAVDREQFADLVTSKITAHPNIRIIRQEIKKIPETPTIIASGPLTSPALANEIAQLTGKNSLFFYDAIAPIVTADSIDMTIAFKGSRYTDEKTSGDYINCPFTREEFERFAAELQNAERVDLREFETAIETGVTAGPSQFFEGCLPIELLARRGSKSLEFGPMKPIGLKNPETGRRPYAVVQLRQDNQHATLYNLVGFQTNLKLAEQRRIFRMIPGLENAEFVRYGQMHRNTYIYSPAFLNPTCQVRGRQDLFLAGQITGVEGYAGNIALGLLAGINAARSIQSQQLLELPPTTMLGALCRYITMADEENFQPMKANFGILPALTDPNIRGKRARAAAYAERALKDLEIYLSEHL